MKNTILSILLFLRNLIFGQIIYVSPLGNNESGDGTEANPYLNIQYANV